MLLRIFKLNLGMDKLSVLGLLLAAVAILGGFTSEGGDVLQLWHGPAFFIVLGGAFGAVMLQSPWAQFKQGLQLFTWMIKAPQLDFSASVSRLTEWGHAARLHGFLALEQAAYDEEEPLLKRGLNLLVDGVEHGTLLDILDTEQQLEHERLLRASRIYDALGGYSPTIGILGAVLGLILALADIANADALGQGIATAFVATIYGVGFANLLFLPTGTKIRAVLEEQRLYHAMLIEGLCSISRGENPKNIEQKLLAYKAH